MKKQTLQELIEERDEKLFLKIRENLIWYRELKEADRGDLIIAEESICSEHKDYNQKILQWIVDKGEEIEKNKLEQLKNIGCSMCMPPSAKSICNCEAIRMDLKLLIEGVISKLLSPIKSVLNKK